jgi:hypothetical protein
MAEEGKVFPTHGKVDCSLCFPAPGGAISCGKWSLRNDPGHWGSSTPIVLVLGFSKGPTQKAACASGPFEDVAFAGLRRRLQRILSTLGIVSEEEDFNRRFLPSESFLAFASLIRCSVEMPDAPPTESGKMMLRVFRDSAARRLLENCSNRFLRHLPPQLKLVVMLGVQNEYIVRCRGLIEAIYGSDYRYINPVAYSTGQVTWVHVTHPSGQNGHFNEWLAGANSPSKVAKRDLAKKAVEGIAGLGA